jgi:conjugal transfer/type IV secretion protein DotA/TraY
MKIYSYALLLCLSLFASHAGAQSVSEAIPEQQALATMQSVTDEIKIIASASGLPIPEGALDGAKSTDAMYQVLKMIFGKPLANISQYTTNKDPAAETGPVTNVNVIVFMFSLMAGIGLIGTLIAAIWTILESLVSLNTSAKFMSGSNGDASPFAFLVSRTTVSTLINVPIPAAGGMAMSQVVMLFMALMGIGLGSSLFYVVANRMLHQPLITYTSKNTETFFLSVSQAMLCLEFLEKNQFIKPEENKITDIEYGPKKKGPRVARGTVVQTKAAMFGPRGVCGVVDYPSEVTQSPNAGLEDAGAWAWFSQMLSGLVNGSGDNAAAEIEAKFKPATKKAMVDLFHDKEFRSVMRELMDAEFSQVGYQPEATSIAKFAGSYDKYKSALKDIFFKLDEGLNKCQRQADSIGGQFEARNSSLKCGNEIIRESIATNGFMLAGTYTYILNSRQSMISNTIETTVPEFEFDVEAPIKAYQITSDSPYYLDYANRYEMLRQVWKSVAENNTYTLAADLDRLYEGSTGDSTLMQALGDALYSGMRGIVKAGYIGQDSSFQNPEPITQLATIGNLMMALPLAIVIGDIVIGKSLVGKMLTAKKAISTLAARQSSGMMSTVAGIMLASTMQAIVVGGFFLATFVPAIPYVMWNMAIFGYISYVILVVIGVPIMVAAKPLKDGDGFVGGVKTGYMMAFTVFMRPAAMVIGLVAGMVLSRIFSWVINATYFESIQIAYSNGFNIAAVFGVPLMYAILQLTAIYKAYSMINEVPAFLGKMTETDRAHTDFGEESERNRVGGLFVQGGNTAMGGLQSLRNKKMQGAPAT